MNELIIVARMEAKKDKIELVKSAIIKLLEPTRKEEGCLQYELSQDNENPEVFILFERWISRDAWQDHVSNPLLKQFMEETESAMVSFTINQMSKV